MVPREKQTSIGQLGNNVVAKVGGVASDITKVSQKNAGLRKLTEDGIPKKINGCGSQLMKESYSAVAKRAAVAQSLLPHERPYVARPAAALV